MKIASIDIGTNSILLLVVEIAEGRPPVEVSNCIEEPRLGEGFHETGLISERATKRALSSLSRIVEKARAAGAAEIVPFGTEIFRRATNGDKIAGEMGKLLGKRVRILSPEEEAKYAFFGAVSGLEAGVARLIVDVGGGSTELVYGKTTPERWRSFPIGAVVLEEECGAVPPLTDRARKRLSSVIEGAFDGISFFPQGVEMVGVGGTITTLAAFKNGLDKYIPEKVHGTVLTVNFLTETFETLADMPVGKIAALIPFAPARADILLSGAAIFLYILHKTGSNEITVSDRGARWSILLESGISKTNAQNPNG